MAIIKVKIKTYIEVETDDPEIKHYRRYGPADWWYLSGLSWERLTQADTENIESQYQGTKLKTGKK